MTRDKINQAIANGYDFDFSGYFSKGWEIYKKNAGPYIFYAVIASIIPSVAGIIPGGGVIAGLLLSGPLAVGYYIFTHSAAMGRKPDFAEFFNGFKKMTPLLGVTGLMTLVLILCLAPAIYVFAINLFSHIDDIKGVAEEEQRNPLNIVTYVYGLIPSWHWVLLLVGSILATYFSTSFLFAYKLVQFFDMTAVEALKTSWAIIKRKWFVFFGFNLVLGLLASSGVILCIIGVFITLPLLYIIMYCAFADITGLHEAENDEVSNIDDHLILPS